MDELAELKKSVVSQVDLTGRVSKLDVVEKEAQKAQELERKTLMMQISQTKQLEETKVALEDAKLEIRSLQDKIKSMDSSSVFGSRSYRNLGNYLMQNLSTYMVQAEEVTLLRNELRFATEAEGKSQKAMDDLATALKEVLTEASRLKGSLLTTQSELEKVKAEAESKGSVLKNMEEKYHAALEESERLKCEIEESSAAWNAKEESFRNCMRMSEEDISKVKSENDELLQSQRVLTEENAKLRDLLKQSGGEASIVKNDLEYARKENAQLKDLLSAKEDSLQGLKQEYERFKISEAAAITKNVNDLKISLDTASTHNSSKLSNSPANESINEGSARLHESTSSNRELVSSERWDINNPRFQAGHRHLIGVAGEFKESVFEATGSLKQKDRLYASFSNISDIKAVYSTTDDADTLKSDDFDNTDAILLGNGEQADYMQKKKRTLLRRFRDMLRRKNIQQKS